MTSKVEVSSISEWVPAMEAVKYRPDLSDVTFVIGKEHHYVYGCRVVLAARSRILQHLLYERDADGFMKTHLYFPEYTIEEFSEVLDFAHCGRCLIKPRIVIGVWMAAVRFGLETLQSICAKFLARNTSADNVCYLLQDFQRFASHPMSDAIEIILLKFFKTNADFILRTTCVGALSRDKLIELMTLPDLLVQEYTKFVAAVTWTKCHYNPKLHENPSIAFAPFLNAISLTRIPIRILIENVRKEKLVPEEILAYACAHNIMKEDFAQVSQYEFSLCKSSSSLVFIGAKTSHLENYRSDVQGTRRSVGFRKKLRRKSVFEITMPLRSPSFQNLKDSRHTSKFSSSLKG